MPSIPGIKQREGTLKTSVRNIVNKNVCTCKYRLNSSERVRNTEKMGVCNSGGFEVWCKLTYSLGIDFCPYNSDVCISGVSARWGSTVRVHVDRIGL